MSYVKCDVYKAPSNSGGKIWALPCASAVDCTFSGAIDRWENKKLTVNSLKATRERFELVKEKRAKGYFFIQTAFINLYNGLVLEDLDSIPISEQEVEKKKVNKRLC
ncbi:hypothetical protein [Thiomicrorhabdus aquaedulcis]|uniref:hypothetical protein n=1 Tax=Thiomicrorhabdus aquaedulcis TaxID=2211106 RepID=UPI000FD9F5DB|nr:hypothetical protein [Thiomicrorhabdus aquaedulcis]